MTTLTIPAGTFARLTSYATPHTLRDALLPVFNWLHFYEDGGVLCVEATDRYTMIRAKSSTVAPAGFDLRLDRVECAAVVSVFKARRGSTVVLSLTVEDDRATFALAEGVIAAGLDLRITVTAQSGEFPQLRHIFGDLASAEPGGGLPAFQGDYLRRLPAGIAQFKAGKAGKPCGFYGRDEDGSMSWAVAIMPMRMSWGDLSQDWAIGATTEEVES